MNDAEPVRWVTKAEAAKEMEISLSTLDRMIRKGEVEVVRRDRRVYVQMQGPEHPSDEELLHRAVIREDELQRTVKELQRRASEMEEAYRKERTSHGRTRMLAGNLKVAVVGLIALLIISVLISRLYRRRRDDGA